MKDILLDDRPYEKLENYGAESLSDSELLAIIIKSGSKDMNSLQLAQLILSKNDSGLCSFDYLDTVSLGKSKDGVKNITLANIWKNEKNFLR